MNLMSIKLVAVDIDGTLLTNDRKVTPEVFEAVQEAKNKVLKSSSQLDVQFLVFSHFLTN